jgi:hypothetical protein
MLTAHAAASESRDAHRYRAETTAAYPEDVPETAPGRTATAGASNNEFGSTP